MPHRRGGGLAGAGRACDIVVDEDEELMMAMAAEGGGSGRDHLILIPPFSPTAPSLCLLSPQQYHEARSKEWNGMQMREEGDRGGRAGRRIGGRERE